MINKCDERLTRPAGLLSGPMGRGSLRTTPLLALHRAPNHTRISAKFQIILLIPSSEVGHDISSFHGGDFMGWFFLFLVTGIAVLVKLAGDSAKKEKDALHRRMQIEEAAAMRRRAMIETFKLTYLHGWKCITTGKVNGVPGMVAIAENGLLMKLVTYSEQEEDYILADNLVISPKAILSFDVVIPEKSRIVTHTDKVPVTVKQKRSTVGRAAVGGLLLGPVGVAVGAASGLNGKDKVEYHEVKRNETITEKGAALLVLGIKDPVNPKLTIKFDKAGEANEWWYRIQSARA